MRLAPRLSSRSDIVVDTAFSFYDAADLPAAHLVNFTKDGDRRWVMISGDTRVMPVLAFGHGSHAQPELATLGGTDEHLDLIEAQVEDVRSGAVTDFTVYDMAEMSSMCIGPRGDCPPGGGGGGGCNGSTTTQYGPLLATRWDQDCPYNSNVTRPGCSSTCGEPSPPIGCVATAGAQIVRYHEFPATYEYGMMLNRYTTSTADRALATRPRNVANMMVAIASGVNMNYGCNASGASTGDLVDVFRGMGYSRPGEYVDWSALTMRLQARAGLPVVLKGSTSSSGHAWVGGGYRQTRMCSGTSYGWVSMNWGWGGLANGWYSVGTWEPRAGSNSPNFDRKNKMIVNVRP